MTLRNGGTRISHVMGVDLRRGTACVVFEEWVAPGSTTIPHGMEEIGIIDIRVEGLLPGHEVADCLEEHAVWVINEDGELSVQREMAA